MKKVNTKAPKVASPSKKHPNFMRESLPKLNRKSPMAPMTGKRLSK
jgi:hypothetical protein